MRDGKRGEFSTWAMWWAVLANVEDFASLAPGTIRGFYDGFVRLCRDDPRSVIPRPAEYPEHILRSAVERSLRAWRTQGVGPAKLVRGRLFYPPTTQAFIRKAIEQAWHLSRLTVRALLSPSERTPLGPGMAEVPVPFVAFIYGLSPTGYVEERGRSTRDGSLLESALLSLFEVGRAFPIRRCGAPGCGEFFARVGAMKFCSKRCQARNREAKRRGTVARRQQMARASQAYRARLRDQSRKVTLKSGRTGRLVNRE